jgi:hypothetical protein
MKNNTIELQVKQYSQNDTLYLGPDGTKDTYFPIFNSIPNGQPSLIKPDGFDENLLKGVLTEYSEILDAYSISW